MKKPKYETQPFEVTIPDLSGEAVAEVIPIQVKVEWDEEIKEWLLTPEALRQIEDTKARHMGLLLPVQLKELRERHDCTQSEMGELFQVGEKSWTRWETGKHRPSRSINLLIRALYEGGISIDYLLRCAGKSKQQPESRRRLGVEVTANVNLGDRVAIELARSKAADNGELVRASQP